MVLFMDIKRYLVLTSIIISMIVLILLLKYFTISKITINNDQVLIYINFVLPMKQQNIKSLINITSDIPNSEFAYSYKWLDSSKLYIKIKEVNFPKGKQMELKINNISSKLFINKKFSTKVQFKYQPDLIKIDPERYVCTNGPIKLYFNTPINKGHIKDYVITDFDYYIYPLKIIADNGFKYDYSKWIIYPKSQLNNQADYNIKIKRGLKSKSGLELKNNINKQLKTGKKPIIMGVFPEDNSKWISIYPKIICEANEKIKKGYVRFQGMRGKVTIKDNHLEFLPDNILKPYTKYKMIIEVVNYYGEKSLPVEVVFQTMDIDKNLLWVEVILGKTQKIIVREGNEIIKKMMCSGGTKDEPTILGTFNIKDRGDYFYSYRFKEGAKYWVRILEQYLFHSVPRDQNNNIIQSELEKIGTPASHGCIRLKDDDAKWFYDNIPHNTMVIIHQ